MKCADRSECVQHARNGKEVSKGSETEHGVSGKSGPVAALACGECGRKERPRELPWSRRVNRENRLQRKCGGRSWSARGDAESDLAGRPRRSSVLEAILRRAGCSGDSWSKISVAQDGIQTIAFDLFITEKSVSFREALWIWLVSYPCFWAR